MSAADLDAADDLHQSTTPGPWIQDHYQDGDESGPLPRDLPGWNIEHAVNEHETDWLMTASSPADAKFIVQAHRQWPALIAELRAARKVVDEARAAVPVHVGTTQQLDRLLKAVRAYDEAVGG